MVVVVEEAEEEEEVEVVVVEKAAEINKSGSKRQRMEKKNSLGKKESSSKEQPKKKRKRTPGTNTTNRSAKKTTIATELQFLDAEDNFWNVVLSKVDRTSEFGRSFASSFARGCSSRYSEQASSSPLSERWKKDPNRFDTAAFIQQVVAMDNISHT